MGLPPQNPPPPSPPNPQDPRAQRDYARAWAKAQREQVRSQVHAQRQYWRWYWRGAYRPSIIRPLILIAIGVVALLIETGRLSGYAVWSWYVQWWPLVLIAIGVVLLLEYFFDRSPYRRRVGGFWVLLILLVLFTGWGGHAAWRWGPHGVHWGANGNDMLFFFGTEHDHDIQTTHAMAGNASITVNNPRGSVNITPATDDQVHLSAHEEVFTSRNGNAQKIFTEVTPVFAGANGVLSLTVPAHQGTQVDLTLAVPVTALVTVNAGRGDVVITGLKGAAAVNSGHGSVKLDGLGGDARVHMGDGNSDFAAHDISGQVFVSGRAGDATLSEIKGQTTLNGEFYGDLHLEQMGGPVSFSSSRTQFNVPKLTGDLTLDSGNLTASGLQGPVRVITRSKDIELTGVSGDLRLENSNGDVSVVAAAPLGNMQIANHTGDLSVTVPASASFTVSASTTDDSDVNTGFPLTTSTSNGRKQVTGTVGKGGVMLNLSTTHGDLNLDKSGIGASFTNPPSPRAADHKIRHLKMPKVPVAPPTIQ